MRFRFRMSFKWEAPKAKDKKAHEPAATAKAVAAGGVTMDAVICRIKTMADGGLRVELDLPELEPEVFALLYALRNKAVKITIK